MLATFPSEQIFGAYEAALYDTSLDLVVIKNCLGQTAVDHLNTAAVIEDIEERTVVLKDVLHNELGGLETAEAQIDQWADQADLPEVFGVSSSLEGPVYQRTDGCYPHFDDSTADYELMFGPIAISIGTKGQRSFKAIRLPQRLTNNQLLGLHTSPLPDFAKIHATIHRLINPTTEVVQEQGDLLLIPGTPWPVLHSVEVDRKPDTSSVVSSYIIALEWLLPQNLRHNHSERKKTEQEILENSIREYREKRRRVTTII